MRTTISIDDGLLADAKRRAEELHTSLSALVEEALRARLATSPAPGETPPFRLVVFGGDGLRPGASWSEIGRFAGEDELERLGGGGG